MIVFRNLFLGALVTLLSLSLLADVDQPDLSEIYNEKFQYALPKKMLIDWFDGRGFDELATYSDEEKQFILELAKQLKLVVSKTKPLKLAVITAGAPGAGKTALIESIIEAASVPYAYIDPNDQLKIIYTQLIVRGVLEPEVLLNPKGKQEQYTKWRPASNFIAHWGIAHAVKDGKPFYFGSTSASVNTKKTFKYLKDKGYELELVHVTAPGDVCVASVAHRDKLFYQTTPADVENKGKEVMERATDTFFIYPDKVSFYWRDAVKSDAKLAAVWNKDKAELKALIPEGLIKIKNEHGKWWPKEVKEQKLNNEKIK
jgi:predicted ABC-type ATPase